MIVLEKDGLSYVCFKQDELRWDGTWAEFIPTAENIYRNAKEGIHFDYIECLIKVGKREGPRGMIAKTRDIRAVNWTQSKDDAHVTLEQPESNVVTLKDYNKEDYTNEPKLRVSISGHSAAYIRNRQAHAIAVSYTHLTLPTILRV